MFFKVNNHIFLAQVTFFPISQSWTSTFYFHFAFHRCITLIRFIFIVINFGISFTSVGQNHLFGVNLEHVGINQIPILLIVIAARQPKNQSACRQSDPECPEFFPFFTRTLHCSVAGMLVRRVVTTNYWRRGGGGEEGGGGGGAPLSHTCCHGLRCVCNFVSPVGIVHCCYWQK